MSKKISYLEKFLKLKKNVPDIEEIDASSGKSEEIDEISTEILNENSNTKTSSDPITNQKPYSLNFYKTSYVRYISIALVSIYSCLNVTAFISISSLATSKVQIVTIGQLCDKNMICPTYSSCINQTCQCDNGYTVLITPCTGNNVQNCENGVYKECINICPTSQYLDGTHCVEKKSLNSSCSSSIECQDFFNPPQICLLGVCSCPITHYQSSDTCAARKPYGSICTNNNTYECVTDQLLVCNGNCSCPTTHYWNGSTCVIKQSLNASCINSYECQDYLNPPQICVLGVCSCPSTHYASSNSCIAKYTYQISCNSSIQCDDNKGLVCPTIGACNCPNISSAYYCDCEPTFYWDDISLSCVARKIFNQSCTIGYDYQCISGFNFTCDGTCNCFNTSYWNGSSCEPKKPYGSSCATATECQDNKNLTCILNQCVCPPDQYWDSTLKTCVMKKGMNQTCSNSTLCNNLVNLVCSSSTCTCLNTDYWNGSMCLTKKPYMTACASTIECNDLVNLLCSSGYCQCNATSYFNGTYCVAQKEYMVSCFNTTECYTAGNLSCINNKCDCPLPISSKMYWVPAFKNCQILPKNCLEVQTKQPNTPSGIFYVASAVGLLEVYCEMVIDSGGYTFVPWTSLSSSVGMLNDIYYDHSKVLFRIISSLNDMDQPYILTQQLSMYASKEIVIQENSHNGYTTPINTMTNYIYVGFLNVSYIAKGVTMGFTANGNELSFSNCDGLPNSYFVLFSNLNPPNPSSYSVGGGIIDQWLSSALPHPSGTHMPPYYFYFTEGHQGGCGGYSQTNYWTDYYGVAIGLK